MMTPTANRSQIPILIVEDDTDAAEALREYLSPNGYEAHLAHNLEQAERTLRATDAGVVLLDVRLGSEFGLDLIPRMRAAHPDVLFIVMTAYAGTDVAIEAVKRGAHDFLRKPFDPAALVATLERTCELIRARRGREQAIRQLERSEASMRMAQQVGRFGSWTLDLASGAAYWSEQHYHLFGVRPGAFTPSQETFLALVHPEDRDAVRGALARLEAAEAPVGIEYRIVRPDGEGRTMHSVTMVERGDDGTPVRWYGMVQDITERKAAELELLRSRARLSQALEIAELGTFEWHPARRRLQVSPETRRILGLPAPAGAAPGSGKEQDEDDAVLTGRVIPQDRDRLNEAVQAALARSGHFRIEFRIALPGGEVRTIESQGQAIGTGSRTTGPLTTGPLTTGPLTTALRCSGQPGAGSILGLLRDVTKHRLLEQQLLQAQKMEAVGSLAGGIAHDLNNMLQVIRGYIELEQGRAEGRGMPSGALYEALKGTESASELIRRLLAFARGQVLQMRPLDVNELLGQQVQMLRRVIRQDVTITLIPAPRPAVVLADRAMLEQVILNLCVNARDAMPAGGELAIAVSAWTADAAFCELHASARPGPYVRIAIRDSGTGMSEAVLQRIFEPFFTTKVVGKGSGLGLAMVYGIMEQHRGVVTVQSEPGRGSTFTLHLPASEAPPAAEPSRPQAAAVDGKGTILLAEDEPAVRDLVVTALTSHGYRVLVAADGEEALRVFDEHRDAIDLALLDVVMPKLAGPAVYERLIAERPDLAVVFSTGYAADPGARGVVAQSGVPVVHKPYTLGELLQVLRKALRPGR